MYTHQNFLDFCKSLNLDPEDPAAYPEWAYWNSHQDEYPLEQDTWDGGQVQEC